MKARLKVEIHADEGVLFKEIFKSQIPAGAWVLKNPKNIVHMHSYGGLSRFFEALTGGKLLGTFCPNCQSEIWLPPRIDCPDCWNKMEWREINTEGARVYSYSITNYPGAGFKGTTPCPLISLEIPRVCTNIMSYLSEFGDGEPYIGMPVRPVFRTEQPTRTILDLSWIPMD